MGVLDFARLFLFHSHFCDICFSVLAADIFPRLGVRLFGDAHRIGTQVSNQPDHACAFDFDSFIELLRQTHRF